VGLPATRPRAADSGRRPQGARHDECANSSKILADSGQAVGQNRTGASPASARYARGCAPRRRWRRR